MDTIRSALYASRLALYGAVSTIVGVVLSGPLAVLFVETTHPQPTWADPLSFAHSYHPVQMLPYAGGIFLVGGLVFLLSGLHGAAGERSQARATAALVFLGVFATLILFNYVVQTSFVPVLAHDRAALTETGAGPLLASLSMANPRSLSWALEMWGWAFLGVATFLVAPVFRRSGTKVERAAQIAFAANGPVSIIPAILTAVFPGWGMTLPGLVGFVLWNILLMVMAVLALVVFRRWLRPPRLVRAPMPAPIAPTEPWLEAARP